LSLPRRSSRPTTTSHRRKMSRWPPRSHRRNRRKNCCRHSNSSHRTSRGQRCNDGASRPGHGSQPTRPHKKNKFRSTGRSGEPTSWGNLHKWV
jgi:hypothetical protein